MSHKYYDSASASGATPYESAATAANTLAAALGAIGASDEIIWANSTSNETITASTTYTASATYATPQKPQRLYGVSDFDSSPGTLATGAKITLNGGSSTVITLAGNWDIFGKEYAHQSANLNVTALQLHSNVQGYIKLTDCASSLVSTHASAKPLILGPGQSTSGKVYSTYLKNHTVKFGNSGQSILLQNGFHELDNLILAGASSPTNLFTSTANCASIVNIANSDLTGLNWTNLFNVSAASQIKLSLNNVKIPSGANIFTGTFTQHNEVEIINVDSGNTHYRYEKHNYAGSITTDTGIYATTSPLQDDGVSISNKFTSSANCGRGATLSRSYLIPVTDTAAAITPFAEFLVSGDGAAALKTTDVYIDAEYLSDSASPKGTLITSHPGLLDPGTTDIAAGTTAYTGDGYVTERTHRLTAPSFTPGKKGFVKITVHLSKPSTAIYVGNVGVV